MENTCDQMCCSISNFPERLYEEMIAWCRQKTPLPNSKGFTINVTGDHYDHILKRFKEEKQKTKADVVLESIKMFLEVLSILPRPSEMFFSRLEFIRMALLFDILGEEMGETMFLKPQETENEIPQEKWTTPEEEQEYLKSLVREVYGGECYG